MNEQDAIQRIASDLLNRGLRRGGAVLVHSSLKSLGPLPGGPETVVRGLLEALGPEGTLLMPALSYRYVNAEAPYFDLRTTPSNIGALPEFFRLREGTIRSLNPTHSVCGIGPLAEALLGSHRLDSTPCGANSPFRLLKERQGQILMLGCGLRPNTSMHAIEELVEPPYLFGGVVAYHCRDREGTRVEILNRRHHFEGYEQRYDRVGELLQGGELKTGRVLDASVHIIETGPLWARAEQALRANPFYFVDRI
jgi:aminoglycoside 3-N-acetyltransferase